ncbi:MAG TPA: winged helix-turn-helix domain-containing protein [Blastocatellia bacterium]|nr:winged helix-turn-helix domain-containing protein [Blastocatellia bacterium]
METPAKRLYEFGPFQFDAARRLLLREGQAVPLTNKAVETLALLVQNSGRVVEKDELLREVWPDTFVEEGSLSRNISVLRKTLGEGPTDHQYIQTIPKRGYRFVANVKEIIEEAAPSGEAIEKVPDGENPAAVVPPPPAVAEVRPNGGRVYVILLLLLIALAGYAFFLYRFSGNNVAATPALAMTAMRFTYTGTSIDAAISPDGKYVVYAVADAGRQSLWVKQVASGSNVQIVPPADVSYQGLAFSSDGNYVYYNVWDKQHVGEIYRISALGGVATKVIHDVMPSIAISPDNQKIAFVRSVAATGESLLMVANADGSEERRVAVRDSSRIGWFGQPAWSPDGKTLACEVGGVGEQGNSYSQVIAVPAAGGAEKPVSSQQWVKIGGLAWLPDGSGLVMTASDQAQNPLQLWTLSYPDGAAKRISNDLNGYAGVSLTADARTLVSVQSDYLSNVWVVPGGDAAQAQKITSGRYEGLALCWTPDGRIVYVSQESGNPDIWIMDADGRNRKQLTSDPSIDFEPTVSADGRHILFVSLRTGAPHIWKMDIDGGNQTQMTSGNGEWSPACSPDGSWVVYLAAEHPKQGLWKQGIHGSEPIKLAHKYAYQPAISPDGKQVAYSYWDEQANPPQAGREILSLDGTRRVRPFELPKTAVGSATSVQLRWTPDGRSLSYIDNRGGVSNVWNLPVDGGPARQVTDFKDGQIFWFDWSRDGKLACARGSVASDVVLISNFK